MLAAETGHLELSYAYLAEAALMDLDDLEHNTRDGLHIASLAGSWIGLVAGFGGMRDHDGPLAFAPRLPQAISRLAFRLLFRERRLLVEIDHDGVRYSLASGEALEILHAGESVTVEPGAVLARPLAPVIEGETPSQPHGRAPAPRRGSK